jgi:hypothetical protein
MSADPTESERVGSGWVYCALIQWQLDWVAVHASTPVYADSYNMTAAYRQRTIHITSAAELHLFRTKDLSTRGRVNL